MRNSTGILIREIRSAKILEVDGMAMALRTRITSICLQNSLSGLSRLLSTTATTTTTTTTEKKGTGRTPERWRQLRLERKSRPPPKHRSTYTFDRTIPYSLEEALSHVRKSSWANFDETLEVVYRLNVDPRRQEQMVRVMADLPHGIGRKVRVAVFADGEEADEAKAAGAEIVGGEELIDKVRETSGRVLEGFDACLALPEMMRPLAEKVGKMLGPRGLMPSAKTGTVTGDVAEMVGLVLKGRVWHKVDRTGNLHTRVGKLSFPDESLIDNVMVMTRAVMRAKPPVVKRKYVKSVHISSSMGPGVQLMEGELVKKAVAQELEDDLFVAGQVT